MPDGPMTPENNFKPNFNIGGPARLPANEASLLAAKQEFKPMSVSESLGAKEQLNAATGFFKPESRSTIPDIRLQKEDDDVKAKEQQMRLAERAYEQRMSEMYGEIGREGYLGQFMKGVKDLKILKEKLAESTKPETYDEESEKVLEKLAEIRGKQIDPKDIVPSGTLGEAKDRLNINIQDLSTEVKNPNNKIDVRERRDMEDLVIEAKVVHGLEKNINQEIEQTRERMAEGYVNIVHSSLDELGELNKYLEQLKNAYPYDSRWSIEYFKRALESINNKLRNKEKYEEEGLALVKMLKSDMLWASSLARVQEAMGPTFELYFDGELELQRLRSPHTELITEDFMRLFKKDLPGLKISDKEKELISLTFGKIKNNEDIERYRSLNTETLREVATRYQDEFGDWLYALVAANQKNMETSFDVGGDKEAGEHYMDIDEETYGFLKRLFNVTEASELIYIGEDGEKHDVVSDIFNPFCKTKDDKGTNETYVLRMHELVVNSKSYKDELKRISSLTDEKAKNIAIQKLVDKAIDISNKRIEEWEALNTNNIHDRLAFTVIGGLTNLENGVLSSGDLGWRWKYEKVETSRIETDASGARFIDLPGGKRIFENQTKPEEWNLYSHVFVDGGTRYGDVVYSIDENGKEFSVKKNENDSEGNLRLSEDVLSYIESHTIHGKVDRIQVKDKAQFFVKRASELGSIYDNHDITTVMFWARHIIDYDKMADSRSLLLLPTIGWYRERWESEPPYFKPELSEFAAKDTIMRERLDKILSPDNPLANEVARKVFIPGKKGHQPQYYGKFDPRVAKFIKENVWPFVTPWLSEPGKGEDEYYLSVPVFLPTSIPDINFWRTFTLDKPSVKLKEGNSVWHERISGGEERGGIKRKKLSEFEWKNMDQYKYSWAMVNHDQMERWFGPWITPHSFNRSSSEEVEKHLKNPSGLAEKEEGKRKRLSLRAGIMDGGVVRAASSAQSKTLSSVSFSDVLGTKIKSLKDNISPDTADLNIKLDTWMTKWIRPWLNVELDMPSEVRGVKNYPGTSAQCALFTYLQVRRIVSSAIITSYGQEGSVSEGIQKIEKIF